MASMRLPPRNFIIKLKSRCRRSSSDKEVRRFLQTTLGVHSVMVDQDGEIVAISSLVGPSKIIMLLRQGLGLKATLFWEHSRARTLMDAKDILRVFAVTQENGTNVKVKLQNIRSQGSAEMKISVKSQNDDLKSIGGGIRLFGVSSSCCGSFTVAHVHVPMNPKMYNDIGCGNDHGSSNHGKNLKYTPPHICVGYIPPSPPGLPPLLSGGYAPSAPPMETAKNHYHDTHLPALHAPAMGDEYYFDASPPSKPDMEMFDSVSNQFSDDKYCDHL